MDPQITQLGAAAAVVIVTGMFLRHIASENDKNRDLWGNHLTTTVQVLQKISDQIEMLLRK